MTLLKEKLVEPEWVAKKRIVATNALLHESLPDRVSHAWKYTDPSIFLIDPNKLESKPCKLEFSNIDELKKKNVLLLDINDAVKNSFELLKPYFDTLISSETNKLSLLNQAYWSCGYFLYVPAGVVIEKPIIIKAISDKGFTAKRVLIVLEKGASCNIVDESLASNSSINTVSEFFLGEESKLNYVSINLADSSTLDYLFQRTAQEKKSKLTNLIVALGGHISKADIKSVLKGEYAKSEIYGIVLGSEKQSFDHNTVLDHRASFTESSLNFRVALKDKSKSAYTGNLKISHDAIKCVAVQENRNLLLSPDAKAESIPELEILTNNVEKCNHGVTMGQVDKNQIFYLTSRGLSEDEAKKLIIEGFLEPTISRIPDDTLREEVMLRIEKKLNA